MSLTSNDGRKGVKVIILSPGEGIIYFIVVTDFSRLRKAIMTLLL
jgi:hypothetical protein